MKNKKLKIVLDTNIILSSLSQSSPYRRILDDLLDGVYEIYLSTEILLEYEEKMISNFDKLSADLLLDALIVSPFVHLQNIFYHFPIIKQDPDDNKFIDCAFAANAHFLVTNDKHYHVLQDIAFPKITVVKLEEFIEILKLVKSGSFGFT